MRSSGRYVVTEPTARSASRDLGTRAGGHTGERGPVELHIVLVGLPGVGKTSVGRRLAKELQRPFADSDEQLELRLGRTIPQIFGDDGEEAFRRWETKELEDLMARPHPLVVAVGGGAVERPANRTLLRACAIVVWLRASPAFLATRIDPTHRPLLATDPEGALQRLTAARAPHYSEVADAVVDIEPFHGLDEQPKHALARHIIGLLARDAAWDAPR